MATSTVIASSKKVSIVKTVKATAQSSKSTSHTYVKSHNGKDQVNISLTDVMKAMGATSNMSLLKDIKQKKIFDFEATTARRPSQEMLRLDEPQRGPMKMRHIHGSMAVNLTGIKKPLSPTKIPGGLRTVEKVTSIELGAKTRNFLGRETTKKLEAYRTWKLPERVFLRASEKNKREMELPGGVRYSKFASKRKLGEGEREVKRPESRDNEEAMKTLLSTRDKAQLTTKGAKQAAADGARKVLTAVGAMRETEPHLTLTTRRHTAAIEKLRGPSYAAEKVERVTELEEEAEKLLEEKEPVNVQEYAARLANFGGGFGPEIYEYRPVFDADRARAERMIAERNQERFGDRKKGVALAASKPEPKLDSWDVRMRGEFKAGFRSKDIKEWKRQEKIRIKKEKRRKELRARREKGEKVEEEEIEDATPESERLVTCPGRVCEKRPCHKPRPLPPRYKRGFPDFPQYNTCVLVGNWVEERRSYVQKPGARFSVYSFDYRKPVPPVPYTKCPYYANMFSHRGLPYDVLFTHGALPPPRRWTTECQPPCNPCCQKISSCTESRAHYAPPPKESYVVCRYATPKALSSSYEPICKNMWNLHLRGDQLRMVPPTPCR